MPFSDASLTALRVALETSFGSGVANGQGWLECRQVNEDLAGTKEVVTSDEITPDRMPPDNINVGSGGSGTWTADLTGGFSLVPAGESWDKFFRCGLGSTSYSTPIGVNLTGAATLTPANAVDPDEITVAITGTPAVWPAWVNGEFITWAGWSGVRSVLNSVYKVKSGGGTATVTLSSGPRVPASPGTQPGTGVSVFTLGSVTNGSIFNSMVIERQYSVASQFAQMTGFYIAGFDVDMQPKRPCRLTWNFIGKDEASNTVTIGVTPSPASIAKALVLGNDLRSFSLDENGHDFFLNSFKMSVKSGAYPQDERAGTVGPIGIGLGTFGITGRYEFYYSNDTIAAGTVHDQYQKFTDKELHVGLANANGEWFFIHLPRINWTNGNRGTPGKDQPVKGWVEFQAAKGTGFPYMVKVGRL